MATCPNCGAGLSCSCKLRTASNGTVCCTNCLATYEASIKTKQKWITVTTNIIQVMDVK